MNVWGSSPSPRKGASPMRTALLLAALLLAPLAGPARPAAACDVPSVPVFPGAQQAGGLVVPGPPGWVPTTGRTTWATDEPLLNVQQFYYIRLGSDGWNGVPQLPGSYPDQWQNPGIPRMNVAEPILEFSRGGDRERIRIISEAGGFSVWLECRD